MTTKKCTKTYNTCAERLFLLIKRIVLWRSRCRRRLRSANKFPYLVSDDNNGDGSENVIIKTKSRFVKRHYYSNLQGKFPGVELLETAFKFRKRKARSVFTSSTDKTSHQESSRPSRALTAKKCTKKCNVRAGLLFWLLSLFRF